jgi:hypothetical protein
LDTKAALVLLRGDLKLCLRAIGALQHHGYRVAVSWKESGPMQIGAQLAGTEA